MWCALVAGVEYPYPITFSASHAAPELMKLPNPLLPYSFQYKPQDMWSVGCMLVRMLTDSSPFVELKWVGESKVGKPPDHEIEALSDDFIRSEHAAWVRSV